MPIEFSDEQEEFLEHDPEEHARLLAGPGTGKSTTIIEYAGRCLAQGKTGIRLLRFTRAATKELAENLPEEMAELEPTTVHSYAISLAAISHQK